MFLVFEQYRTKNRKTLSWPDLDCVPQLIVSGLTSTCHNISNFMIYKNLLRSH